MLITCNFYFQPLWLKDFLNRSHFLERKHSLQEQTAAPPHVDGEDVGSSHSEREWAPHQAKE